MFLDSDILETEFPLGSQNPSLQPSTGTLLLCVGV